jgi:TPR repeat protein
LIGIVFAPVRARKGDSAGRFLLNEGYLGQITYKLPIVIGALMADNSENKLLALFVIIAQQGQALLLVAYKKLVYVEPNSKELLIEAVGTAGSVVICLFFSTDIWLQVYVGVYVVAVSIGSLIGVPKTAFCPCKFCSGNRSSYMMKSSGASRYFGLSCPSFVLLLTAGWNSGSTDSAVSKAILGLAILGSISWLWFGAVLALYYVKRASWARLQRGADEGNAKAQFHLGMHLQWGEKLEQDFQKAVYYYEKAAAQGLQPAYFHLGEMYLEGRGVEQDLQQALRCFEAASDECPKAHLYLAWLLRTGPGGIKQDQMEARDIVVPLLNKVAWQEELCRAHKTTGPSWSHVVAWYRNQRQATDIVVPRWS